MKLEVFARSAALVLLAAGLTGCAAFNSARITYQPNPIGDELISLHRAMQTGAISEDEFNQARAKLLNQPPGTFNVGVDVE